MKRNRTLNEVLLDSHEPVIGSFFDEVSARESECLFSSQRLRMCLWSDSFYGQRSMINYSQIEDVRDCVGAHVNPTGSSLKDFNLNRGIVSFACEM